MALRGRRGCCIDEERISRIDHIIICAGQESMRELAEDRTGPHHLIGGAEQAVKFDAKRAIDQGTRLGAMI